MKKKCLSLLLAGIMVFSSLSTVMAVEDETYDSFIEADFSSVSEPADDEPGQESVGALMQEMEADFAEAAAPDLIEDTGTDSAQDAGTDIVQDAADDSGQDVADDSVQGTADDSGQDAAAGSAEASAEDIAQDFDEGQAEDAAQDQTQDIVPEQAADPEPAQAAVEEFTSGTEEAAAAAGTDQSVQDEDGLFVSALPEEDLDLVAAAGGETHYDFPFSDRVLLPWWGHYIDGQLHGWHYDDDHPDGIEFQVPVSDVQLKQDESNPSFELIKTDDGWQIDALPTQGTAVVTMVYKSYDTGKNEKYSAKFTVGTDVYEVNVDSEDGNFRLLPGEQMTLTAQAVWRRFDPERQQHYDGDVSSLGFTWKWVLDPEFKNFVSLKQDAKDPSRAVVTAKSTDGWQEAWIQAQMVKGNTVLGTGDFRLDVAEGGYMNLSPARLDEKTANIRPGQSFEVNPFLTEYWVEGSGISSEVIKHARFAVRYDENYLEVKNAVTGKTVKPDETVETDGTTGKDVRLTITRKIPFDFDFEIVAEHKIVDENRWDECDSRGYHMYGLDTGIWFEGNLNQWGNLDLFDEGTQELVLNTENLEGTEYTLKWSVGRHNEKDDSISPVTGFYQISGDRITMDGEKAWNIFEGNGFLIRVLAMAGDEQISRTDIWVQTRNSFRDYGFPRDNVLLPYWGHDIGYELPVYVEDAAHPNGEELRLQITDVKVANENSAKPAVTVKKEDGYWHLEATENYGKAVVTMTYIDLDGSKKTHSYTLYVDTDHYDIWVDWKGQTNNLLRGSSLTVEARMNHFKDTQTDEGHVQDSSRNLTFKWEIMPDSKALVSGKVDAADSSRYTITAKNETGRAQIHLIGYDLDNNGKRVEVADTFFDVMIHDGYTELLPQQIDGESIPGGGTIKITPSYTEYHIDENGKVQSQKMDNVRYIWEYDPDYIEIKDSKGKTVGYNANGEYNHTDASAGGNATFTIKKKKHFEDYTYITLRIERKERGEWMMDGWAARYEISGHNRKEEVLQKATATKPLITHYVCDDCGQELSGPIYGDALHEVKTTAITVSSTKVSVKVGKSVTLKPTVTPADSTQAISFSSSDKKVATVSKKGVVKGIKAGTAKITIKSGSKKVVVTVTVKKAVVKTTKITVPSKKITVKKGKKVTLKPVLTPANSTQGITYSTSNKKVATVSKKGVVKGVKAGTAKITIKSGSKKVVVTVTVK